MSNYEVVVLFDGYSKRSNSGTKANCTCTLIKGPSNIIVDTMTAWDGEKLTQALSNYDIFPDEIAYVICTHRHSDHTGCNYLFKKATVIVGFSVVLEDFCYDRDYDFRSGKEHIIDYNVKVIPTPGHTLQDVSVIVQSDDKGVIAITGDLFENEYDLSDDSIWKSAGSDDEELQVKNRKIVLGIADWIVPGHGPMFEVKDSYRKLYL